MLHFKETSHDDLEHLQALWARGDVMNYVGFPDGLHQNDADMEKWLDWINSARPLTNHYSVYEDDIYCGETFYEINKDTKSVGALPPDRYGAETVARRTFQSEISGHTVF